jgi:hypothetical protein
MKSLRGIKYPYYFLNKVLFYTESFDVEWACQAQQNDIIHILGLCF